MSDTPEVQEYTPEEQALRDALRSVTDPELDMNIVELGLVRQVNIQPDFTEITMIMTTPFCPYGPALLEKTRRTGEDVTRLQYGGISVPKAVDVAPARRVDLALRYICQGALDSSHKNKKPIEECLADEIISAAKSDVNCFSVSKKEEIERVASSAR